MVTHCQKESYRSSQLRFRQTGATLPRLLLFSLVAEARNMTAWRIEIDSGL